MTSKQCQRIWQTIILCGAMSHVGGGYALAAFKQNGASLVTYQAHGYFNAGPVLDRLVYNGVNAVAVNVFVYQDGATATAVYRHPEKTVLDEGLRDVIRGCRDRGMAVLLKVNVDDATANEIWRGFFQPSDTNAWFVSYAERLLDYARIADEMDVARFSVGCELKSLTAAANHELWVDLIAAVGSATIFL